MFVSTFLLGSVTAFLDSVNVISFSQSSFFGRLFACPVHLSISEFGNPLVNMFSDNDFDELGDLEHLQRVLAAIPDEELIQKLNQIRGNGRNDWPVIGMWNAFLASFLFNHETVEQLLRELRRNKQLRAIRFSLKGEVRPFLEKYETRNLSSNRSRRYR